MKKLFLLALMIVTLSLGLSAKTYLLTVGISNYKGEQQDLRLPAKDAALIKKLYNTVGDCEIKFLWDKNATSQNITKEMKKLFAKAGGNDCIVLFFSGHGSEAGLLTHEKKTVTYATIREIFASSKAKNKIIFADACHSGKLRSESINDGLTRISNTHDNYMMFLSSRHNETSIESRFLANGMFTSALVKGLRGAADNNNDRVITARETFDYVSETVKKLSSDTQHPVMYGNFSEDMVIINWTKKK